MEKGGVFEAKVRALIYIAMGQHAVDARSFEAFRRLLKAHPEITLAHYKAVVREQWARLTFDQAAALRTLPHLLPADAEVRRELLEEDPDHRNGSRRTGWRSQASVEEIQVLFDVGAPDPVLKAVQGKLS